MAQAARYLFDLDFSAPPEPEIESDIEEIPPEPMITVAEHEAILTRAKDEAYQQGLKEARQDREKLASEKSLELQESILNEVSMVYTEVRHLLDRLERDASRLAFTFASRFAEKLVAQEPKAEILALLHQVLAPLRQTPHIVIRINDTIASEIEKSVDQQMSEMGFEGEVSIIAEPTIMAGDCEIEWADGGIGRNLRSAIRQAEQLLEEHFSAIPDDPEIETSAQETGRPEASAKQAEIDSPEAAGSIEEPETEEPPTDADPAEAQVSEFDSQIQTEPASSNLGDPADTPLEAPLKASTPQTEMPAAQSDQQQTTTPQESRMAEPALEGDGENP